MKVLVTGHHGYIGSVLASYLADAGHDSAGLDTRSYRVGFCKLVRTFPDTSLDWCAERNARDLVDAYRELRFTHEEFEGNRCIRLRRLLTLLDKRKLDDDLRWRPPVGA